VLELSLRVTNTGSTPLANVAAHVCLSHDYGDHAETYADPGHERSLVVIGGKPVCLTAIQTRKRAHYRVRGGRPIRMLTDGPFKEFWGPLAPETVDLPLIAGASASGRFLVGLAWGDAVEVLQNGDAGNRCLHVNPAFGDLAPGGSREVRGRVYFLRNDVAALVRRFREDRAEGRF
jgi:hypothetical protein